MIKNWNIHFEDPWAFVFMLLIPALIIWYVYRARKSSAAINFSNVGAIKGLPKTFRQKTKVVPFIFRLIAITLCVVAFARPRGYIGYEKINREGIDIMMSVDVSISMLAQDFAKRPVLSSAGDDTSRLLIAKKLAKEFVEGRPDDRFGLVAFAGESITRCPLTLDHSLVRKKIDELKVDVLPDGTAIGMGLATAVSRLKNSEAKSKVVILLTDGENNSGVVAPTTAAELAQVFGIRVYTIGVGVIGKAYSPIAKKPNGEYMFDYMDVRIDEPMLKEIAKLTGGKYFRATSEEGLREIYNEIDQLEKTRITVTAFRNQPDRYFWFVVFGGMFFALEVILRLTVYRSIP